MKSFLEKLTAWTDIDFAQHELGIALGLVDPSKGSFQKEYKWVYWTANPTGDALRDILMNLVEIGVLEHNQEEEQFRTNPNFDLLKDYPNR